jgi:dTDP-4-dehydrorhamnose 3,5-epimerase
VPRGVEAAHANRGALPAGVEVVELRRFDDERGWLVEVYRDDWLPQPRPVQWMVVACGPSALRGMHVHPRQDDYLALAGGSVWLGLYDVRRNSPTADTGAMLELGTAFPCAVTIPRGVAHAFLSVVPATLLVGVNRGYELGVEQFGCRWDDPGLGLVWPVTDGVVLSERDRNAVSLGTLRAQLDEFWSSAGSR